MKGAGILLIVCMVLLAGCARQPARQVAEYRLQAMQHLYALVRWEFEGRLAVTTQDESFSASINWQHQQSRDVIELVGPMGQGRLSIVVAAGLVVVDDGERRTVYTELPDKVFAKYFAVAVPVQSLRYWVLGLVDPGRDYTEIDKGFVQRDWRVSYRQMQNGVLLPRKINFEKQQTKIKLVIDQWKEL